MYLFYFCFPSGKFQAATLTLPVDVCCQVTTVTKVLTLGQYMTTAICNQLRAMQDCLVQYVEVNICTCIYVWFPMLHVYLVFCVKKRKFCRISLINKSYFVLFSLYFLDANHNKLLLYICLHVFNKIIKICCFGMIHTPIIIKS